MTVMDESSPDADPGDEQRAGSGDARLEPRPDCVGLWSCVIDGSVFRCPMSGKSWAPYFDEPLCAKHAAAGCDERDAFVYAWEASKA
jgi:hypothetical protein